jgi:hypothetical protein
MFLLFSPIVGLSFDSKQKCTKYNFITQPIKNGLFIDIKMQDELDVRIIKCVKMRVISQ